MTDLTPNHPAVKAGCQAAGEWTEGASVDAQDHITLALHMTAACITAALPHLTADDLRNTPAGRALMAEGKSAGWDDALKELRKGQGMQRALAGTLATRKPNYREADA